MFFGFFVMSLAVISAAWAVESMPDYDAGAVEAFKLESQYHEDKPYGIPELSYGVYLPKDWTEESTPDEGRGRPAVNVLNTVGRYVGPAQMDMRSVFTVDALELDFDITAQNWFVNHALDNGYTVERMDAVSEQEVHVLYIDAQGTDALVVRAAVFINGPYLMVARYTVPQKRFKDERAMQQLTLDTFDLLALQEREITRRNTYAFLDQSYFEYPTNWVAQRKRYKSVERMEASILKLDNKGVLDGRIRVFVVSRMLDTSLSDEVKRFLEGFSVEGYGLGGLIERQNFQHHPDMDFVKTESYMLEPDSYGRQDYELWASVLRGEEYYYIVTLLTPARGQNNLLWSSNVEVYKGVLSSLRRTL